MSKRGDLLETRFRRNMTRINELVTLVSSNQALKPTSVFGKSTGARADILRAVVVFLHATFEVALRSHISKPGRALCFYGRGDLEKALIWSGLETASFRPFYPPLTQMAKRRVRIVHEADLSDGETCEWSIADDWQLIMWLMAVPAFYYQMRLSLGVANPAEQAKLGRLRAAMAGHVVFAGQLLAFPKVPPEVAVQALKNIGETLTTVASTLEHDSGD